jgi:carbamoyl-phosphate synthase small subunit
MEAILALEDGRVFRGRAFGAHGERDGEVVFNTAMSGYQEILTDPSYRGQILCMTYPEMGNYGVNGLDVEADVPHVQGMVVRNLSPVASNFRATQDLHQYLVQHDIPGITEVDTRALTRHLRTRGALRGVLSCLDRDVESLARKARGAAPLEDRDLVGEVSRTGTGTWSEPRVAPWGGDEVAPAKTEARRRCVAFDYGTKRNILRLLHEAGFDLTLVPAAATAEEVLALDPEAVFLSNGPGDPAVLHEAIASVRGLVGKVPIFGICLGFQIAALALGAKTFKLKFGHHGANHPVMDLRTRKVEVTSQNHGYGVDPDSLPADAKVTHVNLNDGTCQGFVIPELRLMAVQFHPEASPGPHDSVHLFREFRNLVDRGAVEGVDHLVAQGARR